MLIFKFQSVIGTRSLSTMPERALSELRNFQLEHFTFPKSYSSSQKPKPVVIKPLAFLSTADVTGYGTLEKNQQVTGWIAAIKQFGIIMNFTSKIRVCRGAIFIYSIMILVTFNDLFKQLLSCFLGMQFFVLRCY